MALGWEDISVARTDGTTDIFCLAGLLRDDNLMGFLTNGLPNVTSTGGTPTYTAGLPYSPSERGRTVWRHRR